MTRSALLLAACTVALGTAASASPRQTDLGRFETLATRLARQTAGDVPDPVASEALEIVVRHAASVLNTARSARAVEQSGAPFAAVAGRVADPDGPPATRYADLSVSADVSDKLAAIVVTYGPVSRLAVFDRQSGRRLRVPTSAAWMMPWSARPVVSPDGTLALLCESVQDMGMRVAMRMDVFKVGPTTAARTSTMQLAKLLDWGGFRVRGNQVTVIGIESPKGFLTTMPERLFETTRVYSLADGEVRLVKLTPGQPEVRYVDQWLVRAYAAKRPDTIQARLRRDFPEPGLLEGWRTTGPQSRPTVELAFADGTARFVLARIEGSLRLVEYRKVK